MKKQIPNLITVLNLLCGCLAILYVVSGDLVISSFLVIAGMFFDFFDGLVARLLHVQSKLGVQLDSLADMVSFGVVPGLMMFQLLNKSLMPQELRTGFEATETLTAASFISFKISISRTTKSDFVRILAEKPLFRNSSKTLRVWRYSVSQGWYGSV